MGSSKPVSRRWLGWLGGPVVSGQVPVWRRGSGHRGLSGDVCVCGSLESGCRKGVSGCRCPWGSQDGGPWRSRCSRSFSEPWGDAAPRSARLRERSSLQPEPRAWGSWKESQNHRMVGVGRDLCGSSSPTLLLKQGHLQQGAQDLVQAGLEYLQRRRLHKLPGQPGPGLRHPQREEVLPQSNMFFICLNGYSFV